jgi:hypothetical protein
MRSSAAWSGEGKQTAREGGWRAGGGGEEGLLEARGGGPKVWKRKGDSAGWPWPLLLPTTSARTCPKPFSPLSLAGRPSLQAQMQRHRAVRLFYRSSHISAVGGWRLRRRGVSIICSSSSPARPSMHARRSGACCQRRRVRTALAECDATPARPLRGGPRRRQCPPGSPFQRGLRDLVHM